MKITRNSRDLQLLDDYWVFNLSSEPSAAEASLGSSQRKPAEYLIADLDARMGYWELWRSSITHRPGPNRCHKGEMIDDKVSNLRTKRSETK